MRITPCHEDWNKMIPNSEGKYCIVCDLTVSSLQQKTLDEIEQLKEEKGKICGRITRSQLSEFQYLHPLKRFAIALFLVFGTGLFTTSYAQVLKENEKITHHEHSFLIRFKAEKTDGTPLKGVYLNFDTPDNFYEGSTDKKGELTLSFDNSAEEIEVYINISYANFYGSLNFRCDHSWVNHFDKIIFNPETYTLSVGDHVFYEEIIMGDIAPIEWEEDPFEQKTEHN